MRTLLGKFLFFVVLMTSMISWFLAMIAFVIQAITEKCWLCGAGAVVLFVLGMALLLTWIVSGSEERR